MQHQLVCRTTPQHPPAAVAAAAGVGVHGCGLLRRCCCSWGVLVLQWVCMWSASPAVGSRGAATAAAAVAAAATAAAAAGFGGARGAGRQQQQQQRRSGCRPFQPLQAWRQDQHVRFMDSSSSSSSSSRKSGTAGGESAQCYTAAAASSSSSSSGGWGAWLWPSTEVLLQLGCVGAAVGVYVVCVTGSGQQGRGYSSSSSSSSGGGWLGSGALRGQTVRCWLCQIAAAAAASSTSSLIGSIAVEAGSCLHQQQWRYVLQGQR